ncbi:unnamed protein product [Cuscuta campestris]|uniref:E3 ubiquitin-protein ligase RMA n=2 Tax=Cuscuta sect. Cleistogrammica TaxID=1824901 RepID=A0A484MKZ6_9ASTE|nr:hypothetical protein DM860_002950 [Cuscuta australis]VFQ89510.1 unnamed protein product [Cuscuta campestris]
MAVDHHFKNENKSISAAVEEDCEKTTQACFDCNICLDFARDPVVTLCGHLYCWPCIYEWFNVQARSDADDHVQCPVCKTELSLSSVVPLYGSGKKVPKSDQEALMKVPPRPSPQSLSIPTTPRVSYQDRVSPRPVPFDLGLNPHVLEMYGDMVLGSVLGNPGGLYSYHHHLHGRNGSPTRLRRHELQADKSLNRITLFLFCCFFMCLLLF